MIQFLCSINNQKHSKLKAYLVKRTLGLTTPQISVRWAMFLFQSCNFISCNKCCTVSHYLYAPKSPLKYLKSINTRESKKQVIQKMTCSRVAERFAASGQLKPTIHTSHAKAHSCSLGEAHYIASKYVFNMDFCSNSASKYSPMHRALVLFFPSIETKILY